MTKDEVLLLIILLNYLKILAENHIRNTSDLVNYIDNNINNADVFNIEIPPGNLETNTVNDIKNIRKYFNYVWNGEILGQYFRRSSYCYCNGCCNDWKKTCKNIDVAGEWESKTQKLEGIKIIQPYVSSKKRKS
jgi:hypothetical protein